MNQHENINLDWQEIQEGLGQYRHFYINSSLKPLL